MKRYVIEKQSMANGQYNISILKESDSLEEIVKAWQLMPQWIEGKDNESCISVSYNDNFGYLSVGAEVSDEYEDFTYYKLVTPDLEHINMLRAIKTNS